MFHDTYFIFIAKGGSLTFPDFFIVYGANSFIGSEFAKMIRPEVKKLILFYPKKTDKIAELLPAENVKAIQSDILDFNDFKKKIHDLREENCINNLGAVYFSTYRSVDHKPLGETGLDLTKNIIDVNLFGAIHFLKGIFSINQSVASTRIVMLGSHVSRIGLKNGSVYAATKAAIANLTRSVAMEEGIHNTLINTVSPGPVETDNKDFSAEYTKFRQEYFDTQLRLTSLKRLASVSEICQLIMFLTSMENKHITGEELFITGGSL